MHVCDQKKLGKLNLLMPVRPREFWVELFIKAENLAKTVLQASKDKKTWADLYYDSIKAESVTLVFNIQKQPHIGNTPCKIEGTCSPSNKDTDFTNFIDINFSINKKYKDEFDQYIQLNLTMAIIHETVHALQFSHNPTAMDKCTPPKVVSNMLQKVNTNLPDEMTSATRKKAIAYYFAPAEIEARAIQFAYIHEIFKDQSMHDLTKCDSHAIPDYLLQEMYPTQKAIVRKQGLTLPDNFT